MVPTDDPTATVRTFATRFVEQSFADAVALLTADGRELVVDSFPEEFQQGQLDAEDALEQYWWGLYGQYGAFEDVREVTIDGTDATVEFAFENGTETATLELDSEDDGIAGFSFSPEYEVPAYVDESAFAERDVTVDAGDVTLGGILTVPEGTGPFPAVLLVHGAGIHDPDGTAGNSKILKDLAWGLASEGIATLRYEKRLAEHEVADEDYTLDTVVTDDAVAALSELAAADAVDEDAVFVAGHSQGGMCAPRITARHGGVAGIVNLDGPADPPLDPEDADIIRYEFERDGDLDEEQTAQLEDDRETLRRIAAGDFEDDETLHGRPGTWHRSVNECTPAETACDLGRPVFVAKTCRADEETQSELVEFMHNGFREWQAATLPDGSRVELYESLDHYFQAGPTPTTMDSLYFGGNVEGEVVADLVAWIRETQPQ
ncbi:alpha/beta fold hydrolase [Haloarchaeobius sp. TZWSO28]|uniref:alpha/beta hydrolase n=1 Tax=Haloarchaeobius sp. TZWSO28 TaxID=3446119 RepID=UPI003EBBA175